jgi:hypothetical protein
VAGGVVNEMLTKLWAEDVVEGELVDTSDEELCVTDREPIPVVANEAEVSEEVEVCVDVSASFEVNTPVEVEEVNVAVSAEDSGATDVFAEVKVSVVADKIDEVEISVEAEYAEVSIELETFVDSVMVELLEALKVDELDGTDVVLEIPEIVDTESTVVVLELVSISALVNVAEAEVPVGSDD